jgi:hypothetical protein
MCWHGETPCHGNRASLPGEMAFSNEVWATLQKTGTLKSVPFVTLVAAKLQEQNCFFRENII